jgi:hypothetical protein
MINLKSFPGELLPVYRKAVAKKLDVALKARLKNITPKIEKCLINYKTNFDANTLHLVTADGVGVANKADLEKLYSYKSKAIRDVREEIRTAQLNIINNTCQNCTINSVNSMDHVLPFSAFPEFCVNPINLFPSCTECNSMKNAYVAEHGNYSFLNLYLDKLPNTQYLFPNVKKDKDGDFIVEFTIDNRNNLDQSIYKLIYKHYKALDLFNRMCLNTVDTIRNIQIQINTRMRNLAIEKIKAEIIQTADENRKYLGFNHFKHLAEIALAKSDEFIATF